ncbi:MAG: type II secretion system protein [Sulfurimonas sp.]|nr:type II secretion system protein [Sulfurimonas sp.]
MRRLGFTMIELIFVIVIMGIIGKFGVEFLAQAYKSFIFSSINNGLQAKSQFAVEMIASRLQYRIKDSVITRSSTDFLSIGNASGSSYKILEWVGSDIEGFRGTTKPSWSGIIDINASSATLLISPETNTTDINNTIAILSHQSGTSINDAAIYFVGADSSALSGYGWDGSPISNQNASMHPIKSGPNINEFVPRVGNSLTANNFTGVDVYEYYQLAWTAYAVGIDTNDTLRLYYDYQPWDGESYTDGKSFVIMEEVSTFQFTSSGSLIKIQVCTKTELKEVYSLCKEKTIF